ncbi:MAG: hypothetical protein GX131_08135 [candidate division WS1 bacterium]|nr:hypothetical protein [candidate division WS1 bacterium]
MSDEQRSADGAARAFDIFGGVVGLIVFLVGIAMIIMVFTWVREVFEGVDAQVQEVRTAQAQAAETTVAVQENVGGDEVVVATPYQGPTVVDVGVIVGLKMLGLLVLGWLGALVAAKGAQLSAAHRGKRE